MGSPAQGLEALQIDGRAPCAVSAWLVCLSGVYFEAADRPRIDLSLPLPIQQI